MPRLVDQCIGVKTRALYIESKSVQALQLGLAATHVQNRDTDAQSVSALLRHGFDRRCADEKNTEISKYSTSRSDGIDIV
jgi:hypothetical protein